jgi:hypothetical protein
LKYQAKGLIEKGFKVKFVVRRAVIAVVAVPFVASACVLGYAVLVGLGAGAGITVNEAWSNGWLIAGVGAVFFTFATQVNNFLDKVIGE